MPAHLIVPVPVPLDAALVDHAKVFLAALGMPPAASGTHGPSLDLGLEVPIAALGVPHLHYPIT